MTLIAYMIEAHTDVEQLIRLCDALIQSGDVFIHVDKKTKDERFWDMLTAYSKSKENMTVLKTRVNVAWGGYSQVECYKELLLETLNCEKKYSRFVLLSGLDYPIWSPKKIVEFWDNNKDKEFVGGTNISNGQHGWQLHKIQEYHYFRDVPLPHKSLLRRIVIGGTRTLLKALGVKRKSYTVIGGRRFDVYYGSSWTGITRECAEYIYKQLTENRKLIKYFKTCYAPDELVVPSIVFNSKFARNAVESNICSFDELATLHYTTYKDFIWSYDEKYYETIVNSGKMFFRKAISRKSEKLIEMIKKDW